MAYVNPAHEALLAAMARIEKEKSEKCTFIQYTSLYLIG